MDIDEAKAALRAAIGADPGGPWASKLRFELAAAEFASRRFAEAERLARDEVARLLDGLILDTSALAIGADEIIEVLPELAGAGTGAGASTDERFLQLWPHRHGTDAMFAAYLRRR